MEKGMLLCMMIRVGLGGLHACTVGELLDRMPLHLEYTSAVNTMPLKPRRERRLGSELSGNTQRAVPRSAPAGLRANTRAAVASRRLARRGLAGRRR
jgi:hypothetical protein